MLSKSADKFNETIYSVTELNQFVRNLLEESVLSIWIEGELSNFSCPSSGHWYFSIKDQHAQVRCVLFNGQRRYRHLIFENGTQVLLRAKISLYAARGEFQLIVEQFELAGEGALRRAFEQLKSKLAAEGLFNSDFKKKLPPFPKTIGVITSESGAVLKDICSTLKRRFPSINIILYPCLVQGTLAAKQISQQIIVANQRQECDLFILARGGGSIEDLWPFNEEQVARAIFSSSLPIISAIGHETDFTIADFVADIRAGTPSIAAQIASPDKIEYQRQLFKINQHLNNIVQTNLHHKSQKLDYLTQRLRHPLQRIQDTMQRIDTLGQRIHVALNNHLNRQQQRLVNLSRTLHAISPLASLNRGYSILQDVKEEHIIINKMHMVSEGTPFIARLSDGKLLCRVEKKIVFE